MTIDGVSYPIEPPFLVMATQNPIESEGTYNLPEAQLDRFLFKLVVEYPSAAEETDILRLHTRGFGLDRGVADQLDVVTSPAEVREMQRRAESVLVDDHVLGYIATWCGRRGSGRRCRWAPRRAPAWRSCGARGPSRPWKGAPTSCPTTFRTCVLPALRHRVMLDARGRDRGTIGRRVAHRADPVGRGPPAMKMIWPGRALGVALLVPALLSLALFVSESVWPARAGARRGGRRGRACSTWSPSGARAGCGVERHVGRVCSLDEPARRRAGRSKTRAARPGRCGCATTFPTNSRPSRPRFEVTVPGRRQAMLAYRFVPKRRGTYRLRAGRCARGQPPRLLARAVLVAAARPRFGSIPTFTRSRGSRCWRGATG